MDFTSEMDFQVLVDPLSTSNAEKVTDRSLIEQKAYQQALSDFCIEELLEKLSNYCD